MQVVECRLMLPDPITTELQYLHTQTNWKLKREIVLDTTLGRKAVRESHQQNLMAFLMIGIDGWTSVILWTRSRIIICVFFSNLLTHTRFGKHFPLTISTIWHFARIFLRFFSQSVYTDVRLQCFDSIEQALPDISAHFVWTFPNSGTYTRWSGS